jgi:putative ABC transport system substrate-binding protein
MQRRDFITLLGGAAAGWPLAAQAQQRGMPLVGLLFVSTPGASRNDVQAFLKGLSQIGFVEGKNVTIEYRYTGGQFDPIPELVADLVRRQVAVIVTPLSVAAALAAKAATATTPIVFSTGVDPVQVGVVANLNRPGGNVTGILTMNNEIVAKRLGLLHELLPTAKRVGVLVNPSNRLVAEAIAADLRTAASTLGLQVESLPASTIGEIDQAFASFVQRQLDALVLSADPFFAARQSQILTLAARHAIPAIWASREMVVAGGLMEYSSDPVDVDRQLGLYAGRILKGEKPGDLPVQQSTKVELFLNLKTANALGLTIPPTLLARADEVIE